MAQGADTLPMLDLLAEIRRCRHCEERLPLGPKPVLRASAAARLLIVGQRVQRWAEFGPRFFPLPHPSPRNTLWLRRNPWFEAAVVPALRERVRGILP